MVFSLVQEQATLFKLRTLHMAYCSWGAASEYHTDFCTALKSSLLETSHYFVSLLYLCLLGFYVSQNKLKHLS